MERGSGLTRRTPLAPGTKGLAPGKGLSRGTGLAPGTKGLSRGAGLTRSTPMTPGERALTGTAPLARQAPASRPRKARVAPEVRDAVRARSGGRCEVGVELACRTRRRSLTSVVGASQHHRLPGRMGGSKRAAVHAASNLLDVCGHGTAGCHGWIERNRETALANGWLLHEGADPAAVPVALHDGRRVLLTDAGTYGASPGEPGA